MLSLAEIVVIVRKTIQSRSDHGLGNIYTKLENNHDALAMTLMSQIQNYIQQTNTYDDDVNYNGVNLTTMTTYDQLNARYCDSAYEYSDQTEYLLPIITQTINAAFIGNEECPQNVDDSLKNNFAVLSPNNLSNSFLMSKIFPAKMKISCLNYVYVITSSIFTLDLFWTKLNATELYRKNMLAKIAVVFSTDNAIRQISELQPTVDCNPLHMTIILLKIAIMLSVSDANDLAYNFIVSQTPLTPDQRFSVELRQLIQTTWNLSLDEGYTNATDKIMFLMDQVDRLYQQHQ
jgi:hypothetical protein